MHSCVFKFWITPHFIAIIEACFTASRRVNKIGPGGGTRTGGGRCGRRRFDRRTASPSPPPPVTIAAAPVAQPIAGIRRALAHIGGLMEACGHESQIGWSAFLYFPGVRGGAGGRGGLVGARRMAKAQQSFRAVRILFLLSMSSLTLSHAITVVTMVWGQFTSHSSLFPVRLCSSQFRLPRACVCARDLLAFWLPLSLAFWRVVWTAAVGGGGGGIAKYAFMLDSARGKAWADAPSFYFLYVCPPPRCAVFPSLWKVREQGAQLSPHFEGGQGLGEDEDDNTPCNRQPINDRICGGRIFRCGQSTDSEL